MITVKHAKGTMAEPRAGQKKDEVIKSHAGAIVNYVVLPITTKNGLERPIAYCVLEYMRTRTFGRPIV